jgi:hypothetical protein
MVDLQSVPIFGDVPFQEIEDQFPAMAESKALKPRILLACPPMMSAYNLRDHSWGAYIGFFFSHSALCSY